MGDRIAPSGRRTVRHRPEPAPRTVSGTPRIGDRVRLPRWDQVGQLLGITPDGQEADVQLGSLRTRVPMTELQRVEGGPPVEPEGPPAVIHAATREAPSLQIDLRGQRALEAVENLDRHLDQAALAGTPWIRVVHGVGTGAVKAAVREHLRGHPVVGSVEDAPQSEGGAGATLVHLR